MMRAKHFHAAVLLVAATVVSSCVGGEQAPVETSSANAVRLAIVPSFTEAASLGLQAAGEIERIRVVAEFFPEGGILDSWVVDVDPSDEEWVLDLETELPGGDVNVVLVIELISIAEDGSEVVEFSGRSEPIVLRPNPFPTLNPDKPILPPPIPFGRGPVEALDVAAVTFATPGPDSVAVQSEVQVEAIAALEDGTPAGEIFWTSLDTTVASVDIVEGSAGPGTSVARVTGLAPGEVQIAAAAGRIVALRTVVVRQAAADVVVTKSLTDAGVAATEGDVVSYTISVENLGPATAANVQIADSLDPGLALAGFTASGGVFDSASAVWTFDSIPVGGTDTLVLFAKVDSGTVALTLTNRVRHLGLPLQVDPVTANDADSASITVGVTEVDIVVTKTLAVDTVTLFEGDVVEYRVVAENHGPETATQLIVLDSLDSGLRSAGGALVTQGAFDSASAKWSIPVLRPGEADTLRFFARVDSGTVGAALFNRARLFRLPAQVDTDPTNDSASVSIVVDQNAADLQLTKTVTGEGASFFEGDTVVYRVVARNLGPRPIPGATIVDSAEVGLTVGRMSSTSGTIDTLNATWSIGPLSVGAADTLLVFAAVDSGAVPGTLLNRVRSLGLTGQIDPNPTNDAASAAITVLQRTSDIRLTKTVDNPTPFEGDTVTFTVAIRNLGPFSADSVRISDVMDPGLTSISVTPTTGTWDGTSTWSVGRLGFAARDTLFVTARVDSGTVAQTLFNRGSVLSAQGVILVNPTDDTASASVTVGQKQVDLAVSKSVNDSTPAAGDTVTYTVVVQNAGPDAAAAVAVHDTLPAGMTFVSATATSGSYSAATHVWQVGASASGQTDTLWILAEAPVASAFSTQTNRAWLAAVATEVETNPGNDADSVALTIRGVDLQVTHVVSKAGPAEHEDIDYTVTVMNVGSLAATGVTLAETLPAGVSFLSVQSIDRGSCSTGCAQWTVGTLLPGDTAQLVLRAQADAGTDGASLATTVSLTASNPGDLNAVNDTASVTITVAAVDHLSIAKMVTDSMPAPGDTIDYTVTVSNSAVSDLTNVVVTDTLPGGLTFAGLQSTTAGSCNVDCSIWTIPAMAPGQADTLVVRVLVGPADSAFTNTAVVRADQTDSNPSNDSASVTIMSQGVQLAVGKTVDRAVAAEGETVTYTLVAQNLGGGTANSVVVRDTLPSGVTFVSAVGTGSYSIGTGDWSIGTLLPGDSLTIDIQATIDPGQAGSTLTNVAFLQSSAQADTDPANDTASVSTTVTGADYLRVVKTVDSTRAAVGSTVRYTLSAVAIGPGPIQSVVVNDTLPAGLTFVTASGTGSYVAGTGDWTIGAMNPGDSVSIDIDATIGASLAGTTFTNTAFVKGLAQTDTVPANDTASAATGVPGTDLQVTGSISSDTVLVGDTLGFTVMAVNTGPDSATNVQLGGSLTPALRILSGAASQGVYDTLTRVWSVGAMAAGDTATLSVLASALDTITASPNVGLLQAVTEFELNATNDSAAVPVTVLPDTADVTLSKAISNSAPAIGDTVRYTFTLNNFTQKSGTLLGVQIFDTLPTGVVFDTVTSSFGSVTYDSTRLVLAELPESTTVNIFLDAVLDSMAARVDSVNLLGKLTVNTAYLQSVSRFVDGNAGNDTASASFRPSVSAVGLSMSVNKTNPIEGDSVVISVTSTDNFGGDFPAQSQSIAFSLPAGLTYQAHQVTQTQSYDPGTGIWTIPAFPNFSNTLQILAIVGPGTSGSTLTSSAVLSTTPHDGTPGDNQATVSISPKGTDAQVTVASNKSTFFHTNPQLDSVIYFVNVQNNGPGVLTNVLVHDTLPAEITNVGNFIQSTGTVSVSGRVVSWTIPTLSGFSSASLDIEAHFTTVPLGDTLKNRVRLISMDQTDTLASNDTAQANSRKTQGAQPSPEAPYPLEMAWLPFSFDSPGPDVPARERSDFREDGRPTHARPPIGTVAYRRGRSLRGARSRPAA